MCSQKNIKALDDALVLREQRITIGSCNYRLSTTFKPKEPTFRVALDVLTLTPFYPAFLITASLPVVYMQEFWATKFVDPPFEEEILTFIRELGYPGNIKLLSDVKVDTLPQPWRTFGTIINKCLSGKVTGIDTLRLSRAQILWGLYHQEKVDYVYLLWEDLVFQIENKELVKDCYVPFNPENLTNPAMKESEAYKTYHDLATRKGTGVSLGVLDAPTYQSDDEEISWKSSAEDDDDEENFTTHDDEARQEEGEEERFDPRVQTPSHVESTDDEEVQGVNIEDDQPTNVQTTQVTEDTHVIITPVIPEGQQQSSSVSSGFVSNMLNPRPDTCIDSIFTLNTEATSLVDVPVTTIAEPPLVSATTLPPPPTPLITHMQQTPVPTPTTVLSSSLQDLPNFGSLFGFGHRLKTLETNFSEFKQTNQFAKAVSSIPGIVDAYLANKMHEAVKTVVQLQSDKLRDEALSENEAFLNSLDDNIKKIIKAQVKQQVKAQVSKILPRIKKTVNEQLEAEVMTRSSTKSKTSHAVAANLSELELKKILIDKMESNKSIHISDEQKNLYKSLVEAYESDKLILDTYEPESTSALKEKTSKTTGKSTDGSKSQHKSVGESAHTEKPMYTDKDLEEPAHQEFDIGATEEQYDEETSQHPDWFQKPAKIPTPDRDWNKTLPAIHGPVQPWLSNLAREEGPRESFDELMDTPLDFSAFMMNRLKIDTLTPELLAGPTFELMKGTCKSLVELEYFFEEVYKATTYQLDWHNPKGQQYPRDLRKPLPLIPNSCGRQVIPFDHFINNDLAYLSGGVSSRTYETSSEVLVNYDKHALWGISHWGRKRQQFYRFAANRESARDVYSKRRIIDVTKLQIMELHGYKNLDWITVRRDDDKLYTFKEGYFKRLRL
ncbi:hypothetical protein Tco_0781784 [Tanacetum coccineum]